MDRAETLLKEAKMEEDLFEVRNLHVKFSSMTKRLYQFEVWRPCIWHSWIIFPDISSLKIIGGAANTDKNQRTRQTDMDDREKVEP